MHSVSLVSRVTARSLQDTMFGFNRHLVSGHEISRLQYGLQLIMARYTRIINCRPCCNLYIFLSRRLLVLCFQSTAGYAWSERVATGGDGPPSLFANNGAEVVAIVSSD